MSGLLSARRLAKSYGGTRPRAVVRDISLEIAKGEYVAIVGESGIGKSTLLNLIAGLDAPDAGSVVLDGVDLTALDDAARTRLRRVQIGFVFQAFYLLPHLTVFQNVALPLSLAGAPPARIGSRVGELLASIGLEDTRDAYPRELSGGELQRVAIARAIVHRPLLLLADEPTGNLDPETGAQVLSLLRDQVKREAGAGILVTHSAIAASTADRVYALTGDGLVPR